MRLRLLSLALFLHASTVFGADLLYDTLKTGLGVRPLGMGGAYTALAEGDVTLFYNPAGLSTPGTLFRTEFLDFKQSRWAAFTSSYAYVGPFGYGTWYKADRNGNSTTVHAVGYGRSGARSIDWGVTFKWISAKIGGIESKGWSTDFGLIFEPAAFMKLGVSAKDVLKENVNVPMTGAIGLTLLGPQKNFTLSTDFYTDRSQSETIIRSNVGIEVPLTDGLWLRTGYGAEDISVGATFELPVVEVTYGVALSARTGSDPVHMLAFRLGKGLSSTQTAPAPVRAQGRPTFRY